MVAKEQISFSGNNATVDSWNSKYDDSGTLRPSRVYYASAYAHDRGSVGTVQVTSTVTVQNADINGSAAVGGKSTSAVSVGPKGFVGPYGTKSGTIASGAVTTDFTANIDIQSKSVTGTVLTSAPSTLGSGTYQFSGQINGALEITGNVTLFLTGTSGDVISITGMDYIRIAAGASLTVYTSGGVKLAGNGLLNPGLPEAFQLFGTNPTGQSFDLSGNGDFRGVVCAPTATVRLVGNGDFSGAVIGKTIDLTGNANFHYDESLGNLSGYTPYGIIRWRELQNAADRSAYATILNAIP